jgi:hypothetical protein
VKGAIPPTIEILKSPVVRPLHFTSVLFSKLIFTEEEGSVSSIVLIG